MSFRPKETPSSFRSGRRLYRNVGEDRPDNFILGNSFTSGDFPAMILQHASRVVWMSHLLCGFDWNEVEQYRPDEVWWMPTERFLVCLTGRKPKGLPERKAVSAGDKVPAGLAAQMGAVRGRDGARQ